MKYFHRLIPLMVLLGLLIAIDVSAVDHKSLFPNSVDVLTYVRKGSEKPGQNGEVMISYNYSYPGDNWTDYPQLSIEIMKFNPQWQVVTRELASIYQGEDYVYTFNVTGWPVGLAAANDQFDMFGTSKNNYAITISVSNTESSNQAQDLATEAFAYILPKISEPTSSDVSTGSTVTQPGSSEEKKGEARPGVETYKSYREILKEYEKEQREKESKQKMDKAWSDFEEDQNQAIAAANRTDAAISGLYREGASMAEKEGKSVSGRVEILSPSARIVLFREVDHRFGIGVANRSLHRLTDVKITLYANTDEGKKKIGSGKISSILGGDTGSAPFDIPYKKLINVQKRMESKGLRMTTDMTIEAKYKIRWNKAYFSSETITKEWTNAINPNLDGIASEAEAAATKPPEISIHLVDETGEPLGTRDVLPERNYFVKFTLKRPVGQKSTYAAYGEPKWESYTKKQVYSGWMESYDNRTPAELQSGMDKYNQKTNRRFSGKLGKSPVHFFASFKSPKTKEDQPFKIILPINYTTDGNLEGHEDDWFEMEYTTELILTPGRYDSELSALVKMYVMEINRQPQAHVALTRPGGRISEFTGPIVWLQPTDKWWNEMKTEWEKLNEKLNKQVEKKTIEDAGVEETVGELVGIYSEDLKSGLGICFSADDIVSAQTEKDIERQTVKAVAGALIPMSGIMLPVIEDALLWYPRDDQEKEMVREASLADPADAFMRGTLFTSRNDPTGDRILFKVIEGTMYAIKLGETSF